MNRLLSLKIYASVLLTVGMLIPAAHSQQTDEFNANAPRSVRNDQGSQQDVYDDRDYNGQNYQGQSREQQQRERDTNRSRSDQGYSQNDRGRENNSREGRAGLGVLLHGADGRIVVREVASDSPAERAGLRRGDQVLSVSGQRVDSPRDMIQLVQREEPGSQIDIRIRRDGQERTLTAELERLDRALDTMSQSRNDQRGYGSDSPPWGDDQLMQHVDELEQQVRRMQDEIDDLRSMLKSDPDQQRFSQRNSSQYRD